RGRHRRPQSRQGRAGQSQAGAGRVVRRPGHEGLRWSRQSAGGERPLEDQARTMTRSTHPAVGYLAATGTWALSAGIYVVAKWAIAEMPPWTLCFWRGAIAGAILLPLARGHGKAMWELLRRHWLALLLMGGLGLGLTQGFIYVALEYTTAINAGL